MEVVWRSQGFRLAVQKKLEDTINQYGNDTGRSHEAMEKRIFDKAKTKEEYLENAAKIIIYLREMNFRVSWHWPFLCLVLLLEFCECTDIQCGLNVTVVCTNDSRAKKSHPLK